jgi:hypothetical protein
VSDDLADPERAIAWDQAPNVAALTLRSILEGAPILYVYHDADDDGWQFLDGEPPDINAGRVIGMSEVLRLDPSLRDVADLPPSWMASRERVGGAWSHGTNPRSGDG